jgi:Rrf2 family protein
MPIPARTEYALRAALALAAAQPATVKARVLADTQHIPPTYLYDVLADLRRADLVYVNQGQAGGYALTRPASSITIGQVLRLLHGEAGTSGRPAEQPGDSAGLVHRLHQVWGAADTATRRVLDGVTLADIVADQIPAQVRELIPRPPKVD